ncbi:alpha/beta hydrolase [Sphingomonas turrisvirgatae]|uniref:Poly-beta-hydroxybutyrate polymerase n=1 Tax=Sphingomonas turrisvirgatae TaxID=1888892 RepID=A0A1E3LSF4_9SPHN|nr:alpha/beta hydrolase [Sphingomonas turrisvirgatae]ODP36673.1 poly-beta-hydroxybutyrate polymerase [Sphingomonas turrisvirgatae]
MDTAPQHGPRPLPLFLELLRNETAASPDRRAAALRGLAAYQDARRPRPRRAMPVIASAGRAVLRDYGGDGPPVVFVPSLINPPVVLDMPHGRSLLRWLSRQGLRPLLVDWGDPTPHDCGQDVTAHIETMLLPLLRSIGEPVALVGYCLGGTMALAAAAAHRVRGLALIAAPWRFSGFGPAALGSIDRLWHAAQPTCERLGLVPMEVLQSGFWQLDPGRTIAKFERFGRLPPDSAQARQFVAMEDWANAGAPLTYAAGRQMFDDLFCADLPGRGHWQVGGAIADPAALPCAAVEFVSLTDRIVPAASAAGLADHRALRLGHVGMVVGSSARQSLWQPLADWLVALPHIR